VFVQDRSRRSELVFLPKRQGVQHVPGGDRDEAFGKALEEYLRAPRICLEEGGHGGEQQNVPVARLRAHRLFGQLQESGIATRLGEGGPQDLLPTERLFERRGLALFGAAHLFRQLAERQDRLRRGSTSHAKPYRFLLA